MRIDRFEDDGRCEFRIHGELQLSGTRELLERVLREEDCTHVVLDFSSCEVEDRALSALAELLGQSQLRLGVRGLRERQLRLLEYLGATRPVDM
jgi:hypothetical protein